MSSELRGPGRENDAPAETGDSGGRDYTSVPVYAGRNVGMTRAQARAEYRNSFADSAGANSTDKPNDGASVDREDARTSRPGRNHGEPGDGNQPRDPDGSGDGTVQERDEHGDARSRDTQGTGGLEGEVKDLREQNAALRGENTELKGANSRQVEEFRSEVEGLETKHRDEITALKGEIAALKADQTQRVDGLRAEMKAEQAEHTAALRAEMKDMISGRQDHADTRSRDDAGKKGDTAGKEPSEEGKQENEQGRLTDEVPAATTIGDRAGDERSNDTHRDTPERGWHLPSDARIGFGAALIGGIGTTTADFVRYLPAEVMGIGATVLGVWAAGVAVWRERKKEKNGRH